MNYNLRIAEVRKAAKVTQEELAKRLGINRATLSKYENGTIDLSLSQFQKIASVLGVPLSQLLTQNEQMGTAYLEYFSSDTNEGRSRQLHRSFDLLNEEDQTKVIDYSDSLLKAEMYEAQKDAPEQK